MGVGGMALHQWVLGTKTFQKMAGDFAASLIGGQPAREDVDDRYAARGFENLGAWIMGRNMFGPVRGPWVDDGWKGWWGENPPYHVPVFVLTHHARDPLVMKGGTTFHFVTDGIESALNQARLVAADKDVLVMGGANTIQQFLAADLIDEANLSVVPLTLGGGERLFDNLGDSPPRLEQTRVVEAPGVVHVRYRVAR